MFQAFITIRGLIFTALSLEFSSMVHRMGESYIYQTFYIKYNISF